MKRWRRISIEDPQLRLVRNNLRSIIESEVYHQRKILREKRKTLEELRRTASPSEKEKIDEKIMEVIKKHDKLSADLENSIVNCKICGDSESDMEYIPSLHGWVCFMCARFHF
ncbi:MAG: hypothetical protein ACTSPQ_19635 [Candidatus Helarchaeota archaeon]